MRQEGSSFPSVEDGQILLQKLAVFRFLNQACETVGFCKMAPGGLGLTGEKTGTAHRLVGIGEVERGLTGA